VPDDQLLREVVESVGVPAGVVVTDAVGEARLLAEHPVP
jgi:hypothetical protein